MIFKKLASKALYTFLLFFIILSALLIGVLFNRPSTLEAYVGGFDYSLSTTISDGEDTYEVDGIIFDVDYGLHDFATVATVDSQNRYIIAGRSSDEYTFICRFLQNGEKDTSFNEYGCIREIKIIGSYMSGLNIEDIKVLSSSKILLLGYIEDSTDEESLVLIRLNSDGTLDDTFGDTSCYDKNEDNPDYGCIVKEYSEIYLDKDKRALRLTEFNNNLYVLSPNVDDSEDYNISLWKFSADGIIDETFGNSSCLNSEQGCYLYDFSDSIYGTDLSFDGGDFYISATLDTEISDGTEGTLEYGVLIKTDSTGTMDVGFGDGSCSINGVGAEDDFGCITTGGEEIDGSYPGLGWLNFGFQSLSYDNRFNRIVLSGRMMIREQTGDGFWDYSSTYSVVLAYTEEGLLDSSFNSSCDYEYGTFSSCLVLSEDSYSSRILTENTCSNTNFEKEWCKSRYLVLHTLDYLEGSPSLIFDVIDTEGNVDNKFIEPYDFNNLTFFIDQNGDYVISSLAYPSSGGDIDGRFIRYKNDYQIEGLANTYLYMVDNYDISEGTEYGSYGDVNIHVSLEGDVYFDTLLSEPRGLAIDQGENIYVQEYDTGRIQKFSEDGVFITNWGTTNGSENGEFATPIALNGIVVAPNELVYVIDNGNKRIQVFDQDGEFNFLWNDESEGYEFINPVAITADSESNIYVLDGNYSGEYAYILKFDEDGNYIESFVWDDEDWYTGIESPSDIDVDNNGNIYLSGSVYGIVVMLDSDGVQYRTIDDFIDANVDEISSITVVNDLLYILDPSQSKVIVSEISNIFDEILFEYGESGEISGGGIAVSPYSDNTYLTNSFSGKIQKYDKDGNFQRSWGDEIVRETLPIAEVLVDLRDDRDWSNVTREISIADGKSYIHGLSEAQGAYTPFYLYVPKIEESIGARICPGASSIIGVNTDCSEGYNKLEGDSGIEEITYMGIDYWKVEGVSGSGGMNILQNESENEEEDGDEDPVTNEEEGDGDDDSEIDQNRSSETGNLPRTGKSIVTTFLISLSLLVITCYPLFRKTSKKSFKIMPRSM